MCVTIDAVEMHFTKKVDIFALVTSDSDFTPLVSRLLAKGKQVIGAMRAGLELWTFENSLANLSARLLKCASKEH